MTVLRPGLLWRHIKRQTRTALFCAVCVFILLLSQSCASAASSAGRAISQPPQGRDAVSFYLNFEDIDKIAYRLRKSELIRFMAQIAPPFSEIRAALRAPSAKSMAMMFSFSEMSKEFRFQMALRFGGEHREVLKRIAKKTATGDEILALLGLNWKDELLLSPDPESGKPYYLLIPPNMYVSAHDDLLIFGSNPDRIAESVAAAKNRARRFSPPVRGGGRNYFWLNMGSDHAKAAAEIFDFLYGSAEETIPSKPIWMEGDITLASGGWELDFFTNAASLFGMNEFAELLQAERGRSLYSGGGGTLLAETDGMTNLRAFLYAGGCVFRGTPFEMISLAAREIFESAEGEEEKARLLGEFNGVSRLNVAMTNRDSSNMGQPRAYAMWSPAAGSLDATTDAVAKVIDRYNAANVSGAWGKWEKIETGATGWDTVYTIKVPDAERRKWFAHTPQITLALGGGRILIGALSPEELQIPFAVKAGLYTELQSGSQNCDMGYLDVRGLLKTTRALMASEQQRGGYRWNPAEVFMPFMDFREVAFETFSLEHMRFIFRTGWLDFDDRAFIDRVFLYGLQK